MAKIGTAHIEIKPVIDDQALSLIADQIADAVAEGVRRGMAENRAIQTEPNTTTGDLPAVYHRHPDGFHSGTAGRCTC